MPNIVGVVFHKGGKVYDFDAGTLELVRGDQVVVKPCAARNWARLPSRPGGGRRRNHSLSEAGVASSNRSGSQTVASHSALRTDAGHLP